MIYQKTIKKNISFSGIGLHNGKINKVTLKPYHKGILFRTLRKGAFYDIPLSCNSITNTVLCSSLTYKSDESITIRTVEHLLAALCLSGVDNLLIEVHGDEIPILDGSALPFFVILQAAGIHELNVKKRFMKITEPVGVFSGNKQITIEPSPSLMIDFTIKFDNRVISSTKQNMKIDFSSHVNIREILKSRTFGFLNDIEHLKSQGLILGGSLDNAIVIDDTGIVNHDGLRSEDEFINHKILDLIGDTYAEGLPIIGKITAFRTGHSLNNELMRKIVTSEAFEIITGDDILKNDKNIRYFDIKRDFNLAY